MHWTCQGVGRGVGTRHEGSGVSEGEIVDDRVDIVINGGGWWYKLGGKVNIKAINLTN